MSIAAPVSPPALADDHAPERWRMLALLSVAELLGMSLWFAGSALSSAYAEQWSLDASAVGWLTTIVQLGFVSGTAVSALLNLADIIPARRLFAASALFGALCNAMLLTADGFSMVLLWRFGTGVALAGVYPPAMKMIATWFRIRRGLAVGTIVGALTLGKGIPYLVHAFPEAGMAAVLLTASGGAALAALLVWFGYSDGPYPFPPRPFSWGLVREVVQGREWRLALGGYLGHMIELYAAWTWIPAFIVASITAQSLATQDAATIPANSIASMVSFGVLAIGGIGCIWGGMAADRRGRTWLVNFAMAISGSCAVLTALAFGHSLWLLIPLALVWGFFIIADSAQFSVLVTESVPPHAVGTALTLQTSIGFLLTAGVIQLIPRIVAVVGWQVAFATLAIGPMLGIASITRLSRVRGKA
ncbi:MAG: MFS transporter [Gemmatimonadaceae bacterium]|nr:MFS transporter [Gemmatimonadaceae bacterium]